MGAPVRRQTGLKPGSWVADRYEIVEELGRGGVATVYLAKDTKFGVDIALKVAAASGEAISDFRARFAREARISYQLGKTNGVIRALDWGEIDPEHSLYLVLDLVPGARTLDLLEGPIEERLARLATAAALVEVVHAQGIVHRDIKPGNFLVSNTGQVFLGDFGTARSANDPDQEEQARPAHLTATGVLIGTPLFMAPEQFNDPRQVGQAADVYALGVMLYHCLTGAFPYRGESAAGFLETQLKTRYGLAPLPPSPQAFNASIDAGLDRLAMDSINLDPDDRLGSVKEFLERLRGAAAPAQRAAARPSADLWSDVGMDDDGFVTLDSLRELLKRRGKKGFLELLQETPALLAEHERPVKGKQYYEGRVAFLLSRSTRRPADEVSLGRTTDADLAVRLVSVSKQHVRFVRVGEVWTITESGSSNGTSLGGAPLSPGQARPLAYGDSVCLAQHLTLRFLPPGGLQKRLEA